MAQAAPAGLADDDLEHFIADNRLLDKLGQMGQTVSDRTSDLVITAMGFLGVPYRRGGNSAESGFDCSGFVQAMYQNTIGLVLPRRANEQAAATQKIDKQELQPGDLVFFKTMRHAFSHVGIYVGEGKFIHSPKPGAQVRVEDMGASYWQRRFNGARRVLGMDAPEPQAPQP
jgi:cell wall-associated NlpC family hydrolase